MIDKIQREILSYIKKQSSNYPVTIKELEDFFGYSNSLIHRQVKFLEKNGVLEAKRVAKTKGGVTFYKTPDEDWPKYFRKKCSDCHNKSSINTCIFHEELAELGIISEPNRIGMKLTRNTFACKDFIEKKTHWKRKKLEEFLDENRNITQTKFGFEIGYHCPQCDTELASLGRGFIAKLGSSVLRCECCDSFVKILYDSKRKGFFVHYNEEKGIEYKENFVNANGIEAPEKLYSSDSFGIVIHDLSESEFNFRTRTLTVSNWIGKLDELKYIVAKKEKDYNELQALLEAKGYNEINLILGADKLVSPPPTKQQVGLLRLLRVMMIINKEFCIAMLISRITVIKKIHLLFSRQKEVLVKNAIIEIKRIIKEVENKSWLAPKEWNNFEMRAGKEMWRVIGTYLSSIGVFFPGRVDSRLVNDPSLPHRLNFAYSAIDTLINGVYSKSGEFVKEYCSKIGFCWNGLPGICHGKTFGGIFGLHLDLREQEKILTLPNLLDAIKEKRIDTKDVQYLRGRKRERIYYIHPESELDEQLMKIVEESLTRSINERIGKMVIRDYYMHSKQWLNDLLRKSNYHEVKHHGIDYQPWAIINEHVWEMIGSVDRENLINKIRQDHENIGFKPLTLMQVN